MTGGSRLWLVGLMGAGKSTIGRRVARRLDVPFHDTDTLVEERTEMVISDLFPAIGVAAFRDLERQAVEQVSDLQGVIATGGGAVMDDTSRERMASTGTVVYLEASAETLADRVGADDSRPFLANRSPLDVFSAMYAERAPLYRAVADHVLTVDGRSFVDVVDEVETLWNAS